MKKFPYKELPFLVSMDTFLLKDPPVLPDHSIEEEPEDLRQKVIDRASLILTETQLMVFLMNFAFGMKQRDIAMSLKSSKFKKLKLMSKKTKCRSLYKQGISTSARYKKKFDIEFLKQLKKIKKDRSYIEPYIKQLKLGDKDLHDLDARDLARRMTLFKLKGFYANGVRRLLKKFKNKDTLNKELIRRLPNNVTQPYISTILKMCIKKLKESFKKEAPS